MSAPSDFVPMTSLGFMVLLALAREPLHGYGLIKDVERRSGGVVAPGTGSFYEVLRGMQADGLIVPSTTASADARRRTFELTALGREVLRLEARRLSSLVRESRQLGLLSRPAGG
jgi:DNA-binding PadR family transcriptional regulator